MDIHIGYKEIATAILAMPLLNFLLPSALCLLTVDNEQNSYNNLFIKMGGKIGRKWYFFNNIIISLIALLFSVVCHFLSNWLMFIIALPYFLILFGLQINNHYKRMNALFNNVKICVILATIYTIVFSVWSMLKQFDILPINFITLIVEIAIDVFGLYLLFAPNKNIKDNLQ